MEEIVTKIVLYMGIPVGIATVLGVLLSVFRRKTRGEKPNQPRNILKFRFWSLFNFRSPIHITQQITQGGDLTPAAREAITEAVEKGIKEDAELLAQLEKSQEIIKELRADLERNAQEEPLLASAREKIDAGDFPGADGDLEQAYRNGLDVLDAGQQRAARAAFERGRLANAQIQYDAARDHFAEAARLHPENSLYQNEYGEALFILANYASAIAHFEKALEIDRKALGEEHPSVAATYNNIGEAWRNLGESRKAIGYYDRALAIDRKALGEEHPKVAIGYNNLGSAWQWLAEYRKAIEFFERALVIFKKRLPPGHPNIRMAEENLAAARSEAHSRERE